MIIKEIENPANSFLRYQVGITEKRKAMHPVYLKRKSSKVDSCEQTNEDVEVFHLLGFGSTLEHAESMARVRANNLGIKLNK